MSLELLRQYAAEAGMDLGSIEDIEDLLMLIAGSICKDFSTMGDGARLVGKHVPWPLASSSIMCLSSHCHNLSSSRTNELDAL